jgi:hypothetical protein
MVRQKKIPGFSNLIIKFMKKYYISGIVVIVLIIAGYAYLKNNMVCPDSYGSGRYVSRAELFQEVDKGITSSDNFSTMLGSLHENNIAFETYACGNTDYLIKDGDKFKEVSKSNFQEFINQKTSDLVKIHHSGNSPYFVDDLSSGKKYYFSQQDGKYILIEEKKI